MKLPNFGKEKNDPADLQMKAIRNKKISELQLNIPVGLTQIEQQIPALNIHEDIPQIDDY